MREGLPENYEVETKYAVVDTQEIVDPSFDDLMLPPNAVPTVYYVEDFCLKTNFAISL